MLNKLFRPKWQHENTEIRKAAVSRLDRNEINILKEIALNDRDGSIRQQAISKIEDLPLLQQLITDASTENDREFALKCWANVLTQSEQLTPAQAEDFILDCQNEKLLAGIIAYCDNNGLKELALSGIKNEDQLLSLMHSTKNGRVWQSIIEKLSSEDAIKKALAIVNGRDKKSQQAIKNKLDAIKANQLTVQNNEINADALFDKLNHLLKSGFNPLYEGILLTCKQQWQVLEKDICANKAQNINSLIKQCEQRLANDLQQKQTIAIEEARYSEDYAAHGHFLNQLFDLKIYALTNDLNTESLSQEKNTLVNHWNAIKLYPEAKQLKAFNILLSDINSIIEAHSINADKHLSQKLSNENISKLGFTEINECIDSLNQIIGLLKKANIEKNITFLKNIENMLGMAIEQKKELSQKSKSLLKDIEQELITIDALIDKKELTAAQQKFLHIRKLLTRIAETEKRQFNNSIQRIFNAIKTLEDWKNYSNDEKRLELISQMKNLINDNSDIPDRSEKINVIQQEWKALGHCHSKQLWDQFKSYADEAYLPCQQYYNEQKKIRAFNAEQRKIICDQMEGFINAQDWNEPDWKALEKIYKSAQDEWKKYSPVERQNHQTLQDRFFNNINLLKEKINGERKKNAAKFIDLTTQAEKLIEATDSQQAIEEYTQLQNAWKSIGIAFHKQQQEQWQAFKKAGDALYVKRQSIRKEAEHDRQENLNKANILCKKIIELGSLPDSELANSKSAFEKLKSDFKNLDLLPKDNAKTSLQNFHNACEIFEHNFKNINKREWLRQFNILVSLGNEWLTEELKNETFVPNISNCGLPEKWIKILQSRFQQESPTSNAEYARSLCIEIELLANIETPPEDSALKMQLQMSKLAKSFGHLQTQPENEKIEELYLKWFSQKYWDENSYKHLQDRFLKAGKMLLDKQSNIK